MKIFLTGSSGFIGSHLQRRLQPHYHIHCMQSDLLDFAAVEQEVLAADPDVIVHLAARTEVEKSFYEQVSFSQVNYVGSVNLIEAASKLPRLRNFVFASTMEVYGWQPISDEIRLHGRTDTPVAFDETTKPNPNAPYAVAKLAVEHYLEYMHRARDFPWTALRQTNGYGRLDNDFFVTEQAITQMLRDPEHCYMGYQRPYRNFIYIEDMLDAWTAVITNPDRCCQGQVFTMGPDDPVSINDHVAMIADKIGWRGQVIWDSKPKRHGEIYWLNSNHRLITQSLGWSPSTTRSRGLDLTIEHWQGKIDAARTH
jgi:nucleoside-diphosphate-sugar epimerase